MPAFWSYLKEALAGDGLMPDSLTREELAAVEKLRQEKYATWEWTFGRSPKYSMTNRRRWDGGTLEPHLEVEKGYITGIVFYGDFLSLCSLEPVTEALVGCPFRREDVAQALDRLPASAVFRRHHPGGDPGYPVPSCGQGRVRRLIAGKSNGPLPVFGEGGRCCIRSFGIEGPVQVQQVIATVDVRLNGSGQEQLIAGSQRVHHLHMMLGVISRWWSG